MVLRHRAPTTAQTAGCAMLCRRFGGREQTKGQQQGDTVTRRGWAAVVLTVTALLVYLVMPNALTAPPQTSSSAADSAGPGRSDLAGHGPTQPLVTSDEVTMPPRTMSQPSSADHDALASSIVLPACHAARHDSVRATDCGALIGVRPTLSALQVLRC